MPEMYVKYQGDRPVAYAYGDPWVAQALLMDDWQYPTEEEAIAAWEKYLEKEGRKEDDRIETVPVLRGAAGDQDGLCVGLCGLSKLRVAGQGLPVPVV